MIFTTKIDSVEITFEDFDTTESKTVLHNALDLVRFLVILSQRTEGTVIPTGYAQQKPREAK